LFLIILLNRYLEKNKSTYLLTVRCSIFNGASTLFLINLLDYISSIYFRRGKVPEMFNL